MSGPEGAAPRPGTTVYDMADIITRLTGEDTPMLRIRRTG